MADRVTVGAVAEELAAWWESLAEGTRRLILSILAALPGGEVLEGWIEPAPVGWLEVGLLARLLQALEEAGDVRRVLEVLGYGPEQEEA